MIADEYYPNYVKLVEEYLKLANPETSRS